MHDLPHNEQFWVLFSGCSTLVADVMDMFWLPVSAVVLEHHGSFAVCGTADTISARLMQQDQAEPVKWDQVYEATKHGLPLDAAEDDTQPERGMPYMV